MKGEVRLQRPWDTLIKKDSQLSDAFTDRI